jgi:hypothetical protein
MIRLPHRNGRWAPEEAAGELHRRRGELIGQLRRRGEGRGTPASAQREIVDDAITAVCRRHREGRHLSGLGWAVSRQEAA